MNRRVQQRHVNNLQWHVLVEIAHKHIYEKGSAIKGAQIESLLKPHSLVPTFVCA